MSRERELEAEVALLRERVESMSAYIQETAGNESVLVPVALLEYWEAQTRRYWKVLVCPHCRGEFRTWVWPVNRS